MLLFALLASCKEENEVKTDGEKIAEQINTEITTRNIAMVRIFVWTGTQHADYGETVKPNFKVEGSFLITNSSDFYNFNKLERFNFSGNTVYFYFTK